MTHELQPITLIPGLHPIFIDFCSGRLAADPATRDWYAQAPGDHRWQTGPLPHTPSQRQAILDILSGQNPGPEQAASLAALAAGANTVTTGQQVGLFGGPAFTPYKAATAIALARQATAAGHAHVPVFWLASEDHDFAEIASVVFPHRRELRTLTYASAPAASVPVGNIVLDQTVTPLLDAAYELLGYSDAMDGLSAAYQPGQTLAQAFAGFYRQVFAAHGLLVIDPSTREAHALGAPVFQAAIERADELHTALLAQNQAIAAAGYHAQVAVPDHASLLFLLEEGSGARVALRRTAPSAAEPGGLWQAGRNTLSTADLLGILAAEPERISPSALLRPLFQDTILPNSAYIGGPAEIAYFAQSAVLFERILGRRTPILPRLSATLIETAIAELMTRHELDLATVFAHSQDALAQRLGARAMPIEGKRLIAEAGNALDRELTALTGWMGTLDAELGRAAATSASKMRYQMNRLRRMAASHQLQREESLGRHAQAIANALYPHGGLQERLIGAAWFLARHGQPLTETLVAAAASSPGHTVVHL